MSRFVRLILLLLVASLAQAADILVEKPSFMKSCEIKKPEFTKCSTESIQILFRQLHEGIPGLDSIKSFEPFYLNRIKLSQGSSNAVNIKVELSKIKISGLGSTIVKESQVSPKDYSWRTTLLIPRMRIEGDYALQGRILLIPLNGKGKMTLNIENMDIIMYTKTKLYIKADKIFYNVTNIRVDYSLSGLNVNFTNLFNGNSNLEDNTNKFFNENWQILAEALKQVITQTIEDIMLDTLKKVFDFVPAEYFVSDIDSPEKLYGKNA